MHAKTRLVRINFHFLRDQVDDEKLDVRHVGVDDQITYVVTNFLSSNIFAALSSTLMICNKLELEKE